MGSCHLTKVLGVTWWIVKIMIKTNQMNITSSLYKGWTKYKSMFVLDGLALFIMILVAKFYHPDCQDEDGTKNF